MVRQVCFQKNQFCEFKNLILNTMMFKRLFQPFTGVKNLNRFTAHKYMKSVTETALLYRPEKVVNLDLAQNIKDRVVQAFFDSSNFHIRVTEAETRLADISTQSSPSHSYYQINLPFENNEHLRRKMTQFSSSHVRTGRLLQIMDYIAANVGYRYCTPNTQNDMNLDDLEFLIVTAAIDQIEFYYPVNVTQDCLLSGYVSYVGRSSMEIHIDVLQKIDGEERLSCSANFVMVARDKKTGKSYSVPRLILTHQKEIFRIINELAEQRQVQRKNQSKRGLETSPPTYEQSVIIHNIMKKMKDQKQFYRSISSTTIKNTLLMHVQDKNLSGKIFGGLIMRYGYELGWLCARKFLSNNYSPVVTQIDEVQFFSPVQIGSYIELTATVGYVNQKFLHLLVTCYNYSLEGPKVQTNLLHITFQHTDGSNFKGVYPESLEESYTYIESLRRVNKLGSAKV